uniref:NADH-ubiquinone oxidoreductase chain 1 n=1 Tax=Gregariella coralliophaga TaxID=2590089 RepID=A0A516EZG8_9BIVA|nr:NADH dehydrogenase subunit 1 [Gregariella coralliophaga]QDO71895.1 NADH dehydrogenase subunit 1 [Gregariella coralliophaga]
MKVIWFFVPLILAVFSLKMKVFLSVLVGVIPVVGVLLAVGFFTLLERKLLAIIMIRKGPAKVSFMGILQPFSDAGKLFCKEFVVPSRAVMAPFIMCPGVMLLISLVGWLLYPYKCVEVVYLAGIIQFIVVASISVYGVMVAGWASNSKYALLGSVRAMAQSISYEIPLGFAVMAVLFVVSSFMLQEISMWQENSFIMLMLFPVIFIIWILCMLAETNRAPFDFVEGESELVSGFNVEYSGGGFAMMFMSEYATMLLNSLITATVFLGGSELFMSVAMMLFVVVFVWVRASLPRMRYDKLMGLCWSVLLCVAMSACVFYFVLSN